jgi:hypothetical protein
MFRLRTAIFDLENDKTIGTHDLTKSQLENTQIILIDSKGKHYEIVSDINNWDDKPIGHGSVRRFYLSIKEIPAINHGVIHHDLKK